MGEGKPRPYDVNPDCMLEFKHYCYACEYSADPAAEDGPCIWTLLREKYENAPGDPNNKFLDIWKRKK